MGITPPQLVKATHEFFRLHWRLRERPPVWCQKPFIGVGYFTGGHLPGCYALVRGHRVVYVGSAISRGNKRYEHYGLHSRMLSYVRRDRSIHRPDGQPGWTFRHGHSAIYTIGFPSERAYLAIALEHFPVGRFGDDLEN